MSNSIIWYCSNNSKETIRTYVTLATRVTLERLNYQSHGDKIQQKIYVVSRFGRRGSSCCQCCHCTDTTSSTDQSQISIYWHLALRLVPHRFVSSTFHSHFEPVSSLLALDATESVSQPQLVTQMAVELININLISVQQKRWV